MSRVFWDSMLLIYLIEDHPTYGVVVQDLIARSVHRQDRLLTSYLSVAETLVGIPIGSVKEQIFLDALQQIGFELVAFGEAATGAFRSLRREFGIKPPDAMNLACAAASGTDLYLTGDRQLLQRHIHLPGIHFIADFTRAPL